MIIYFYFYRFSHFYNIYSNYGVSVYVYALHALASVVDHRFLSIRIFFLHLMQWTAVIMHSTH